MLGTFLTLVVTALSLLVVDLVVPGVDLATFPAALIGAGAIGAVNAFVKPSLPGVSNSHYGISTGVGWDDQLQTLKHEGE